MAATQGRDGHIYALATEFPPNVFQTYDHHQDVWTVRRPPRGRYAGRATLVAGADGRIYAVAWARQGADSVVEAYDPSIDTWVDLPPLPTPRWGFAIAAGLDQAIYLFGGSLAHSTTVRSGPLPFLSMYAGLAGVERYDIGENRWETVDSMPTPRADLVVAAAPDGSIFTIGGHVEVVLSTPYDELLGYQRTAAEDVGTVEVYNPS